MARALAHGRGWLCLGSPDALTGLGFCAPSTQALQAIKGGSSSNVFWLVIKPLVRSHNPCLVPLPVSIFDGCAFVEFLLALTNAYLDFHLAVFPIHRHGDNGVTLAFNCADEPR